MPTPDAQDPGLPEAFAALAGELRGVQDALEGIYGEMAGGWDPELEARATELRQRRGALLERWGAMALGWMAGGGAVALTEGAAPPDVEAQTEDLGDPGGWLDDDEEDAVTVEAPAGGDLAMLRAAVLGPRWTHHTPARTPAFEPSRVQGLLQRVGPPTELTDVGEARQALSRIAVELEAIEGWRHFPRAIQQGLVGLFAARLRYLQDEMPEALRQGLDRRRLSMTFPYLTRFSDEARPGFVKGLGRGQEPDRGTWMADAERWWSVIQRELEGPPPSLRRPGTTSPERALDGLRKLIESGMTDPQAIRSATVLALDAGVPPDNAGLIRQLKDRLGDLTGDGRLKSVRRAIRQARAADIDEEQTAVSIPPDWPYFALTRGKVAILVGGDLRESARKAIQENLGFAELSWESGYDIRSVQALAGRIERGGVEFVIFLRRFISHKVTDVLLPACKASGVAWVMVEQGYGLTRVRLAIERYLENRL